jgi:perosamine synthetase
VTPPYEPSYAERTWQSYAVHLSRLAPVGRTDLMRHLLHDGIATRRGVMAIHREPAYAGSTADLPDTDMIASETLMLPLFPGLTEDQQDYVIDRVLSHTMSIAA